MKKTIKILLIIIPIFILIGLGIIYGYKYTHNIEKMNNTPIYSDDGKIVLTTENEPFYIYTGTEIKPITNFGNGYIEGKDYEITYSDNVECGTATAIIKGINKYNGTVEYTFDIVPRFTNVQGTVKDNNYELTWDKIEEASGYMVFGMDAPKMVSEAITENPIEETSLSIDLSERKGSAVYFVLPVSKNSKKYQNKFGNLALSSDDKFIKQNLSYAVYEPEIHPVQNIYFKNSENGIIVSWEKQQGVSGYKFYKLKDKKTEGVEPVILEPETNSILIENEYNYFSVVPFIEKYVFEDHKWSEKKTEEINEPIIYGTKFENECSSYYTYYTNNANRTTNIRLASETISGTILNPGETFSFNDVVGQRTADKGYKVAHIFLGPNKSGEGLGGGVCQVASTLYNVALNGDFEIVERHPHSQRVTYVPYGKDATVSWPNVDFKFKNNRSYPVKIVIECKSGKLTVACFGLWNTVI